MRHDVVALREPYATFAVAAVCLDLSYGQVDRMSRSGLLPLARTSDGSLFQPTRERLIPALELRALCDARGLDLWNRWQNDELVLPTVASNATRSIPARQLLPDQASGEPE